MISWAEDDELIFQTEHCIADYAGSHIPLSRGGNFGQCSHNGENVRRKLRMMRKP